MKKLMKDLDWVTAIGLALMTSPALVVAGLGGDTEEFVCMLIGLAFIWGCALFSEVIRDSTLGTHNKNLNNGTGNE